MPHATPPPAPVRRAPAAPPAAPDSLFLGEGAAPPFPSSAGEPPIILPESESSNRRAKAFWLFTAVPSGLMSLVIHLVVLIGLGVSLVATHYGAKALSIVVVQSDRTPQDELLDELVVEIPVLPHGAESQLLDDHLSWQNEMQAIDISPPVIEVGPPVKFASLQRMAGGSGFAMPRHSGGPGSAGGSAEDLSRRGALRQRALAYGATPDSENAVELALAWIVRHQRKDGSWCFNHRDGDHQCAGCLCGDPGGQRQALNAATAMALLPLLGAGNTHLEGRYREPVAKGIAFLLYRQGPGGSFHESDGNMYSHGLATLALCEDLAMTRSGGELSSYTYAETRSGARPQRFSSGEQSAAPEFSLDELAAAAQRAIHFIEKAQHSGGGWRYSPCQPGDTSVVGWQMMALKSGDLAGLDVNPETIKKSVKFLDTASDDKVGSMYVYQGGKRGGSRPLTAGIEAPTPIGLLCRMYTGWPRDRAGITQGAERIRRWARSGKGMYFYYYATQVMHHYGGAPWREWNDFMRDHLVRTQCPTASEKGSWKFDGAFDSGRLYCTSMAAMTLEVYYRYLPVYGSQALEAGGASEHRPSGGR
jgi:hypothetical protein